MVQIDNWIFLSIIYYSDLPDQTWILQACMGFINNPIIKLPFFTDTNELYLLRVSQKLYSFRESFKQKKKWNLNRETLFWCRR